MRRQGRRPGPQDAVSRRRGGAPGRPRILILGIGNPGRGDDGLGPAAAERIEALHLAGVVADANYQLNVEDALACAMNDVVVFVDAAERLDRPYAMKSIRGKAAVPAMTHAMSPEAVVTLAAELYGRTPRAWLLAIRGARFEMGEGLSPEAEANLGKAVAFLREFLAGEAAKVRSAR